MLHQDSFAFQDEPLIDDKEEDMEETIMQPKETSVLQGDHMLASLKMTPMLLPWWLEDFQIEVLILEFEISAATSLWTNFFKTGESIMREHTMWRPRSLMTMDRPSTIVLVVRVV